MRPRRPEMWCIFWSQNFAFLDHVSCPHMCTTHFAIRTVHYGSSTNVQVLMEGVQYTLVIPRCVAEGGRGGGTW